MDYLIYTLKGGEPTPAPEDADIEEIQNQIDNPTEPEQQNWLDD